MQTIRIQCADDLEQRGKGCLYIVATPIGNLGDITHRAVEVLKQVDWIAAEDTRHTKQLLSSLGIKQSLMSLHEHNELQRTEQLLDKLKQGEVGALVSDAGTPLINDPGYHLVKRLREEEISVVPVPGVSAVITALSCAGLPTDRFTYEGFLPAKKSKRLQNLERLESEQRTMVFYESPHRLLESIESMRLIFGSQREAVIGRELTKKFEQFISGNLDDIFQYFEQNNDRIRGEFVIIVSGNEVVEQEGGIALDTDKMIEVMLQQSLPVKQIAEMVSQLSGQKKKAIYQRVLELK